MAYCAKWDKEKWDKLHKEIDKKAQGKKNRLSGAEFERRVRKDLELKGWIVIKNPNNVIDGKFTQGKSKYNPFTKRLLMSSGGFPDFICFSRVEEGFRIIGVECKVRGYLDKEEKAKCKWLIENGCLEYILIAKKIKTNNKVEIKYNHVN